MVVVPLLSECLGGRPNTYQKAGVRRGTATSNSTKNETTSLARLPLIRTDIVPPLTWRARQARSTNPPDERRTTSGSEQTWPWRRSVKLRRRSVTDRKRVV